MARYSVVCYLAKKTSEGSDQLRGYCDRFFSPVQCRHLPPEGVTGTFCYRFVNFSLATVGVNNVPPGHYLLVNIVPPDIIHW